MIKRNCLVCGKDAYSADTRGVWVCHYCSAKMPPEKTCEHTKMEGQKVMKIESSFTREINLKQ